MSSFSSLIQTVYGKPMKSVSALCLLLVSSAVLAQDLAVTNARVIDGTGRVIESGVIVIRDGRIESVSSSGRAPRGIARLDVRGRTVMPGYIDAHRHLIRGEPQSWLEHRAAGEFVEFLEAGFTTVLSAIDPTPQIVEARERINDGRLLGPRLVVGGFVPLAGGAGGGVDGVDPARTDASREGRPTQAAPAIPREQTLAAVRRLADAGVDAIKTVIVVSPGGPERATLALITEEAHRLGLMSITHAVSVQDTLAAVAAGTDILVHTPHIGQLSDENVRTIVAADIPMTSTLGVFVPYFAPGEDVPLFRDLMPFPWKTLSSAGQGPVNARLLWEAGISYGYGTDTQYPPSESLALELRPLSLVFSPRDIVYILTRNAAISAGRGDSVGTLEPGKFGDLVVLDADPLTDSRALLDVTLVVKGGEIVVDRR
jgi:imidazolonepropionase-like amidohydrolase